MMKRIDDEATIKLRDERADYYTAPRGTEQRCGNTKDFFEFFVWQKWPAPVALLRH